MTDQLLPPKENMQKLLLSMGQLEASDLHLKVLYAPYYRVAGQLRKVDMPPLPNSQYINEMLIDLVPEQRRTEFHEGRDLDFSALVASGDRFRINVYRASGEVHAAIRRVKNKIPSFEEVLNRYGAEEYDEDEFVSWDAFAADMEHLYDESIKRVRGGMDGRDCWRIMALPDALDPAEHDGLGVYWAYERQGAEDANPYGGPEGMEYGQQFVVYRAAIDLSVVNKAATVWANCAPGQGDYEMEVNFYKHASIFVYDVELQNGQVIEIEDYRRC